MSCANNNCAVSPPKRSVEKIRDPTPPPDVIERVKSNLLNNIVENFYLK